MLAEPLPLSASGDAPLYQQLSLSGYAKTLPPASGDNLSIHREFLGIDGRKLDIERLESGELVLVHLTLQNQQRVPDALVVDLLPAGLELENQNLAQSAASLTSTSDEVKQWQSAMENAAIKHQEFRDDRYVAALDASPYSTTHLLYLARAVTPGTYRVPPPTVESMYHPGWQAFGQAPQRLVVRGK